MTVDLVASRRSRVDLRRIQKFEITRTTAAQLMMKIFVTVTFLYHGLILTHQWLLLRHWQLISLLIGWGGWGLLNVKERTSDFGLLEIDCMWRSSASMMIVWLRYQDALINRVIVTQMIVTVLLRVIMMMFLWALRFAFWSSYLLHLSYTACTKCSDILAPIILLRW